MREKRVWRARYLKVCLFALPLLCIACSRQGAEVKDSGNAKSAVNAPVPAGSPTPSADADCKADPKWLDQVLGSTADLFKQAPAKHPAPDCPFYQAAWQVFLYAMRPVPLNDGSGANVPRFLASSDFFTIEDIFGEANLHNFPKKSDDAVLSLAIKSLQRANSSTVQNEPAVGAGIAQAVTVSPCVDQNGNPLYYAIHFNGVMKDFFTQPIPAKPAVNLLRVAGLQAAQQEPEFSTTLEFPPGAIELKSAWQIVDEAHPPEGYFVVKASLPVLMIVTDPTSNQTGLKIDPTKPPVVRSVALLAIHVVFTLHDHPEFIWSTFEHLDKLGNPDTAPSSLHNPGISPASIGPGTQFSIFKAGTQIADANKLVTSSDILTHFDEGKQSFTKTGDTFQTSIYRVYRNALANDANPIDPDVQTVNDSMASIFKSSAFDPSGDHRDRFRLVGAVWMDDPRGTEPTKQLKPSMKISNRQPSGPDLDPDDLKAMVAGEDRLSSTAMESFSQFDNPLDPVSNPNCFACHDTQHIHDGNAKLKPSMINVSHVLSRYLVNAPSPSPAPSHP